MLNPLTIYGVKRIFFFFFLAKHVNSCRTRPGQKRKTIFKLMVNFLESFKLSDSILHNLFSIKVSKPNIFKLSKRKQVLHFYER